MSSRSWGEMIASDRMAVDQEFDSEIEASRFNRQQWGLIMTAIEFEVTDMDDRARLVANTDKLPHVMGELDNIGSMTPGGESAGGDSSGGFVESIKNSLGVGGEDEKRREAAEELAGRYAERLQSRLEERGKWDDVRAVAGN